VRDSIKVIKERRLNLRAAYITDYQNGDGFYLCAVVVGIIPFHKMRKLRRVFNKKRINKETIGIFATLVEYLVRILAKQSE